MGRGKNGEESETPKIYWNDATVLICMCLKRTDTHWDIIQLGNNNSRYTCSNNSMASTTDFLPRDKYTDIHSPEEELFSMAVCEVARTMCFSVPSSCSMMIEVCFAVPCSETFGSKSSDEEELFSMAVCEVARTMCFSILAFNMIKHVQLLLSLIHIWRCRRRG